MKYILLWVVLVLIAKPVYSQINFDLVAANKLEAQELEKIQKREPFDTLKLIYSIYSGDAQKYKAFKKEVDASFEKYVKEHKNITSSFKKLKKFKHFIDKTYLKFATPTGDLSNIAQNKTFNTLSACLLYGYFFQKLGCLIKFKDYEANISIQVDSELELYPARHGDFSEDFSFEFKEAYLKFLYNNKIIRNNYATDQVWDNFPKHYYDNKYTISYSELIGLAYHYKAGEYIRNDKAKLAFEAEIKANKLYHLNKIDFSIAQLSVAYFEEYRLDSNLYLNLCKILLQYEDIYPEPVIESHFNYFAQKILIQQGKLTAYLELKSYLEAYSLKNPRLAKLLWSSYYHYLGYYYYSEEAIAVSLENFARAYTYNPRNSEIMKNISIRIINSFANMHNTNNYKNLALLSSYIDSFPFLLDSGRTFSSEIYYWSIFSKIKLIEEKSENYRENLSQIGLQINAQKTIKSLTEERAVELFNRWYTVSSKLDEFPVRRALINGMIKHYPENKVLKSIYYREYEK